MMNSEPARVAKILALAQARRERRGTKERVLRPRHPGITFSQGLRPAQYQKLRNGQIVGHPRLMREIKQEARRTRLQRRANFRIEKRFAAITRAAAA